jgi:hypothetical protein
MILRHSSIDENGSGSYQPDLDSTSYIKNILLDCKIIRKKNGNVSHRDASVGKVRSSGEQFVGVKNN